MEEVIARVLQIFLALAGAYLLALWFALIVWTYRDISQRSTNAITHIFSTLVVVLFFVPGAVIYLILRPRETLDESFQRTMEEEYLLQDLDDFPVCPSCRRSVRDEFVFCPHCSAELRQPCVSCHRLIDLNWETCPYCGENQFEEAASALQGAEAQRRGRPYSAALQAIDGGRARMRGQSSADDEATAAIRTDDRSPAYATGDSFDEDPDDPGSISRPKRRVTTRAAHDRG